jgi:hypothetical protein
VEILSLRDENLHMFCEADSTPMVEILGKIFTLMQSIPNMKIPNTKCCEIHNILSVNMMQQVKNYSPLFSKY